MEFDFDYGKIFEPVTIKVMVPWRPIDYQGHIQ